MFLAEDPSSIHNTHIEKLTTPCNWRSRGSNTLLWRLQAILPAHTAHTATPSPIYTQFKIKTCIPFDGHVVPGYNPRTQEIEAEGSKVQGHPQLQASLCYMRPTSKKKVLGAGEIAEQLRAARQGIWGPLCSPLHDTGDTQAKHSYT